MRKGISQGAMVLVIILLCGCVSCKKDEKYYRNEVKHYTKILNDPNDKERFMFYDVRSFAYYHLKEYDKAIADINEYIKYYPDDISGYYYKAVYELKVGDIEEAYRAIQVGKAIVDRKNKVPEQIFPHPMTGNIYFLNGLCSDIKGDKEESIHGYTLYIQLTSWDNVIKWISYIRRALLYMEKGEYEKALADIYIAGQLKDGDGLIQKALKGHQDDMHMLLFMIYIKMGKRYDARLLDAMGELREALIRGFNDVWYIRKFLATVENKEKVRIKNTVEDLYIKKFLKKDDTINGFDFDDSKYWIDVFFMWYDYHREE